MSQGYKRKLGEILVEEMISKSNTNLQKLFIDSHSRMDQYASQDSFYSQESKENSSPSQASKSVNSQSKNSVHSKSKTELEHFWLKKKGEVITYSMNPQLGHIFQAKKRFIKIYKNNQPLQMLNVAQCLNTDSKNEDPEKFSEMVYEIMNVSMDSVEDDESLLHYTNAKNDTGIISSGYSVSRKFSQLLRSKPAKRNRLKDPEFDETVENQSLVTSNYDKVGKKGKKTRRKSNFQILKKNHDISASKVSKAREDEAASKQISKESRLSQRVSKYTSSVNLSLDSQFNPKWRISCIISVNQYLLVGFINLDQIVIYKMKNDGKYEFLGKIDLKISKGFHKVIDMDYNLNSSFLSLVYSRYNLNFNNEKLHPAKASMIIEYGVINLTMLDAIKYSSKPDQSRSPTASSTSGASTRAPSSTSASPPPTRSWPACLPIK